MGTAELTAFPFPPALPPALQQCHAGLYACISIDKKRGRGSGGILPCVARKRAVRAGKSGKTSWSGWDSAWGLEDGQDLGTQGREESR